MKILQWLLICVYLLWAPTNTWALSQDPRVVKINAQQLKSLMSRAPTNAQRQSLLLSRARRWGLDELAYQLAKKQAQAHPKSADAHFLYGLAARYYAEDRFLNNRGADPVGLYNSLLPVIREQLHKAQSMDPKSALFNMSYGFWLWQFGGDVNEGLRLVKQARLLDPRHVETIATLGVMSANRSGNCYNLKQAEQLLHLAIQIEPDYALPKAQLMDLLYSQKRYAEAKQQFDAYMAVVPPELRKTPSMLKWKKKLDIL